MWLDYDAAHDITDQHKRELKEGKTEQI